MTDPANETHSTVPSKTDSASPVPTTPADVFDAIDPALKVVSAELEVRAPAAAVFEFVADPARHADWDGNDNVASSAPGHRVTGSGQAFVTMLTKGVERENHVVEFVEGGLIAWKPSEVGGEPFGQLWRWEIEESGEGISTVRHTYDWTELRDPARLPRARSTTEEKLLASIERLKTIAEA